MSRLTTTQEEETLTLQEHNLSGQLTLKKVQLNNEIQAQEAYAYDEAGNLTHVINSQGATETLFNTQCKPLAVTDILGFTTHFSYSYQDRFTEITTNPKNIQTHTIHNPRGWVTESLKKNPQNEIIQKSTSSYNKNGQSHRLDPYHLFCGITPIKTITHHWEYGPMGRIERFLEAGEKETRYHYDEKGRLQTLIKPGGIQIKHEYDDLGRLARYFAHDFDYHYTYDKNNRITTVFDKITKTTTTRRYDPLGYLLHETLANNLSTHNTYDLRGRRLKLTLPDTSTIDYQYNGIYLYSVSRKGYTHTYCATQPRRKNNKSHPTRRFRRNHHCKRPPRPLQQVFYPLLYRPLPTSL